MSADRSTSSAAKAARRSKIVEHATDILGYSFSGDGKQIAFLATEPHRAKKKWSDQGFNQEIYEEDQPLVRVWMAEINGEGHAPRSRAAHGAESLEKSSASELHFNPKEDKIAVALAPSPASTITSCFARSTSSITSSERGTKANAEVATNLNNPGKLGQLAWSPDGKKLAMISGADKHDPREGRLWISTGGKSRAGKRVPK